MAFTIVMCSCKTKPHSYVNSHLRDVYNYKPGTYWVYVDSLTGAIDSLWVYDYTAGTTSNGDRESDYINIQIGENLLGNIKYNAWAILIGSATLNLQWNRDIGKNSSFIFSITNFPYKIGLNPDGNTVEIDSVLSINGNNFNTVIIVNDTHQNNLPGDPAYYYFNDFFYLSESAGIAKMRLYHPQDTINRVWELQRWKIVR